MPSSEATTTDELDSGSTRPGWPLWAQLVVGAVVVPLGSFAALLVLVLGVCMFHR